MTSIIKVDGRLKYLPSFYSEPEKLFEKLQNSIEWKSEKIKIFGKEVNQPRLHAWHGDPNAIYTYSGLTMQPLPWTETLIGIKHRLEEFTGNRFNSVLLNYYRTEADYMGWHRDNEKELGPNPTIASVSLGACRKFQLKHRMSKEVVSLDVEDGSLIIMSGELQEHWLHRVAPTKKPVGPRINLTFRYIVD